MPTLKLTVTGAAPPLLKKGEELHFAHEAGVNEVITVSLGYKGGSRGVSVLVPIGIVTFCRLGVAAIKEEIESKRKRIFNSSTVIPPSAIIA